ncbi:MAG: hypothetical protein M5R40_29525 [Anaerolineae bacterium]|nr:hypothetical protein [Anaerolineae bacterium]
MAGRAEKEFVYKTTLRKVYGLTDAMIADLSAPDALVPNPHYRDGPPAMLYRIARVEAWIEAHAAEVEAARDQRRRRAAGQRRATAVKYDRTLRWAQTAPIYIEGISSDLPERAARYYALAAWAQGRDDGWGEALTEGGLIAYARHTCTNYEDLLRELSGRVGAADAYPILKTRVNEAVCAALVEYGLIAEPAGGLQSEAFAERLP